MNRDDMSLARGNPFCDYGNPVMGDRFIGRARELRDLRMRLLSEGGFGSAAVIGMPRIGKSSLVLEALRGRPSRIGSQWVAVVRVEVGTVDSTTELFKEIVAEISDEVQSLGAWSDALDALSCRARDAAQETIFSCTRSFFKALKKADIRTICVLDEFDAGRYLFEGSPKTFHWLREMGSNVDFKVGLLFVAKRTLAEVARAAGHDSSYWANTLQTTTLRCFSSGDVESFYERLGTAGVEADGRARDAVATLCGSHPYLLDVFAFQSWNSLRDGEPVSSTTSMRALAPELRRFYVQLAETLRDGHRLGKLCQLLVGPQFDLQSDDIAELADYGLVEVGDGGLAAPFAETLREFVRSIESTIDYWPLWREAEMLLRHAVTGRLEELHPGDWREYLREKRQSIVSACEGRMTRERDHLGEHASSSLLDYSYPNDLWQILTLDWREIGQPILGGSKGKWGHEFDILSTVRAPAAHNRLLDSGTVTQARGVCEQLVERLRQ